MTYFISSLKQMKFGKDNKNLLELGTMHIIYAVWYFFLKYFLRNDVKNRYIADI